MRAEWDFKEPPDMTDFEEWVKLVNASLVHMTNTLHNHNEIHKNLLACMDALNKKLENRP